MRRQKPEPAFTPRYVPLKRVQLEIVLHELNAEITAERRRRNAASARAYRANKAWWKWYGEKKREKPAA